MICPVVTYAPTAATKPNIAAQPLKRSASGVIFFNNLLTNITYLFNNVKKMSVFLLFCQKKLKTATYMCRNIPYWCFYFYSDFLSLGKKYNLFTLFFRGISSFGGKLN